MSGPLLSVVRGAVQKQLTYATPAQEEILKGALLKGKGTLPKSVLERLGKLGSNFRTINNNKLNEKK